MELEEAAEVILINRPLVLCGYCKGMGVTHKATIEVGDSVSLNDDGSVYVAQDCSACRGRGGHYSERHREACRVLGMPPKDDWVEGVWLRNPVGIVLSVGHGTCEIALPRPDYVTGGTRLTVRT